jgi:lipoprotein-releasing system ATP-binding protein
MEEVIISAVGLCKSYDEGSSTLDVLIDIDLDITQGSTVAIVGSSGSGKSSLLHLLAGLDVPTNGEVIFGGKELAKMGDTELSRLRNQEVGFVYQFHHLLPEFTADENVAMPLMIGGGSYKKSLRAARLLLEQVGLGSRINHLPSQLSGGERQRVAIARALVNNPRCIFADEPTGNLDADNALLASDLLRDFSEKLGVTVVVATHDPIVASSMSSCYEIADRKLRLFVS